MARLKKLKFLQADSADDLQHCIASLTEKVEAHWARENRGNRNARRF
jgi:hypothetical protein